MKTFFTTVLCALTIAANAQYFKDKGKTPQAVCMAKDLMYVEGDFNKDGINDLFLGGTDIHTAFTYHYAFYFGNADGNYNLIKDFYNISIPPTAKFSINDKGVLRIQDDLDDIGSDIFLFRYQDDGFYLIGGKKDRHMSDNYDYSYNFSTKKYIKTTGEGKKAATETLKMSALPTLKFGWFPLRWDMLEYIFDDKKDSEYKTVMSIIRLLQEKNMLHPEFCDYYNENCFELEGGNGVYHFNIEQKEMETFRHETLEFTKKSDDVWDIEQYYEYDDYDSISGGTESDSFSFEDGIFVFG
jgi:hypothetical protein